MEQTERRGEQLIRNAEAAKARMVDVPGRNNDNTNGFAQTNVQPKNELMWSVMVDQDYLMVAAHIDEAMKRKVINGEYVDFIRLLPRDRVESQENERMELVVKDGQAWYEPVSKRAQNGSSGINSYIKWEQAFRVFSDIYTRANPARGPELVQYNHVIYTASITYMWENVYRYDREFRLHMAQHPNRSWSIILQQA